MKFYAATILRLLMEVDIARTFMLWLARRNSVVKNAIRHKMVVPKISRRPKFVPPESATEGGYLLSPFCLDGLGQNINHLKKLVNEAKKLNRTAVLYKIAVMPEHNNGKSLLVERTKYFDIEKIFSENGVNYMPYYKFRKLSFAQEDVLVVKSSRPIEPKQNERYKVIKRENNLYDEGNVKLPKIHPSPKVIDAAEIALTKMPEQFVSLHIRRGDVLKKKGVEDVTAPQNVVAVLRSHNPERLPVFLMTNEANRDMYANLRNEFKVYQYQDFDHLVEIASQGDNYLLYRIERSIANKALLALSNRPLRNKFTLLNSKH